MLRFPNDCHPFGSTHLLRFHKKGIHDSEVEVHQKQDESELLEQKYWQIFFGQIWDEFVNCKLDFDKLAISMVALQAQKGLQMY
jgi:hypothetical protein